MKKLTEALRNALPHQVATVVTTTGEVNGTIKMLIEAIESSSKTKPFLKLEKVDDVLPAEVFTLDDDLDGASFAVLTKLWCERLTIQQNQDAFLLSLVKRAIAALALNNDLPEDVNAWDMLKLAEIGNRISQVFHTSVGDVYQFNSTISCWECSNNRFEIDSEGYPCDDHGNHVSGTFFNPAPETK
ncbi:hypothetical protein I7Z51_002514 [Vibrio parahaemolyticus]|uniref:hypothetical protein n=1 Tax=Vibrio TaxID=662 RepID=UPI001A8CE745|nr:MULTISPECIES: hypothetical protein [Vibrio]EGQ7973591.1 hypothetical protein [Vibrio parahaemolyticus]MBO0209798.1 hypothetical protein [Vibrio sp. Vb0877]MCR9811860.1 hypothetical protein [Vibrio parahaemolyticus]MDW2320280.1 hypothetical protein [Vibrio sp. 1159]